MQASGNSIEFLVNILLHVGETRVDGFLDLGDVTSPGRVGIVITLNFLLNHDHEGPVVTVIDRVINHGRIIVHDGALGLQSVRLFGLHNLSIRVAHEGDKHVEEGDLGKEGRH